ncbi:MAG: tetratricopeptide repeat protein [Lacipirellulaceae bacterium]
MHPTSPRYRSRLLVAALFSVVGILHTPQLNAEQRITLRSGTEIVATKIEMDGDAVKLQVDDQAALTVPLEKIASITSVEGHQGDAAQRLLLAAFETRAMTENASEGLGLLAEAYRQAPDNPRVAYWYARAVLDNGEGKAASRILEKHRQEIEAALPGMLEPLEKKVAARVKVESLPEDLVRFIDAANLTAETAKVNRNGRMTAYMYFRLVDQHEKPLNKTELQVSCRGSEEVLTPCDDGYFFFQYSISPSSSHNYEHLTLSTASYELKQQKFELSGSFHHAEDAGELQAYRFTEEDKQPVELKLVDAEKNPVPKANVSVKPRTGRSTNPETYTSDSEGIVRMKCYPTFLSVTAQADGYKTETLSLNLTSHATKAATQEEKPVVKRELKLHHGLTATLRLAWRGKVQQFGGNQAPQEMRGAALLKVVAGNVIPNQQWPHWLNVQQIEDRLTLTLVDQMRGHHQTLVGEPTWTRMLATAEGEEDAALSYEDIDLEGIERFKDKAKEPTTRQQPKNLYGSQGSYHLDPKSLFYGHFTGGHQGRMGAFAYKLEVESLRSGPHNKPN